MATRALPAFLGPVERVIPIKREIGPTFVFERTALPHLSIDKRPDLATVDAVPDLEIDEPASEAGGGAQAAGQKIVPNTSMIGQEQTNWCWAAVTQSVRTWAGARTGQEAIATAHIQASGRGFTCAPPNSATTAGKDCAANHLCKGSCNDQHILSVVLGENGRLVAATQTKPTFSQLQALLNNNKPVPCRARWSATAGHFIMVIGWTIDAAGVEKVHVLDPATAKKGMPVTAKVWEFADFASQYSLSGTVGPINFIYEVK